MASLRSLLPREWADLLTDHLPLLDHIDSEIGGADTNPAREEIFAALRIPPARVKVVILGQDPYPQSANAHGLAFSIPSSVKKFPPTLTNIFREYCADLALPIPVAGDLSQWREEGVLLLNSILTCKPGESLSHASIGWQEFTKAILASVVNKNTVGILWGENAKKFSDFFESDSLITRAHPSPLSAYRGFFGSSPFSRCNEILKSKSIEPITWRLQSGR
jgi:uracil-DNA glycosylase